MKVGLFFGSFNPIHHGHLIIANHIKNEDLVDQVWFIVSPHNPFKKRDDLINEYSRLHLVQKAIDGVSYFKVLDIEFKMSKPSYTIYTLKRLEEIYPTYNFSIILGSDSYENIERWHAGNEILSKYEMIVYKRKGFEQTKEKNNQTIWVDSPIIEISSTVIRRLIKRKLSIKYLVPEDVLEEIEMGSLYKK